MVCLRLSTDTSSGMRSEAKAQVVETAVYPKDNPVGEGEI